MLVLLLSCCFYFINIAVALLIRMEILILKILMGRKSPGCFLQLVIALKSKIALTALCLSAIRVSVNGLLMIRAQILKFISKCY